MKLHGWMGMAVASLAGMPVVTEAAPVALELLGQTDTDAWSSVSLSAPANPGFPTAMNFTPDWPAAIPSVEGGDAALMKTANGSAGAPIPSSESIYFVSFSNVFNAYGGSLAVLDETPVAGLATVALQIEIGGANGYDFWNHVVDEALDLSSIQLHYTTTGGESGSLPASLSVLLDRVYTGAIDMPTGPDGANRPEDIFNRLYGLQWDVSGIPDMASFSIEFSGVEHAQLYQLRLDQSDHAYVVESSNGEGQIQRDAVSVFPPDAVWRGEGEDAQWSNGANWESGAAPGTGRNVRLAQGTRAVLGAGETVKSIRFDADQPFELAGDAGVWLSIASGITSASPAGTAHEVSVGLEFPSYHLMDVAEGNSLTLRGPVAGSGFYKQGPGTLRLLGDNAYAASDPSFQANGLIFKGGETLIAGTNRIEGGGNAGFHIRPDTTVRLAGGEDRLDPGFTADLLGATSVLILGDENGPGSQTFAGLTGSVSGELVNGSKIVNGSSEISTLTIDFDEGSAWFAGDLGGEGTNESLLQLVKSGDGVQFLTGATLYTGDTILRGGALALDPAARQIQLDGGVLVLDRRDFAGNLGSGAGEVRFLSEGGFAAYSAATGSTDASAVQVVTLNQGAALSWGEAGFLGDGMRLLLSAPYTDATLEFTNAIDLGNGERQLHIQDGSHATDARLSGALRGSGGLAKTGNGFLELTAPNHFTGDTVVHSGTLALTGAGGALAGNLMVEDGATVRLTNSTDNHGDRLADGAGVTLRGGTLHFTAPAAGSTETTGTLAIGKGKNTLSTSRASEGSRTVLTFDALTRVPGTTLNFSGTGIGLADARNQVRFAETPVSASGILGGWAVAGNEFAAYGDQGVTAFAGSAEMAQGEWTPQDHVRIPGGAGLAAPRETLTADRTIQSLRMVGASDGSYGTVLDLGGHQLRLETGGILTNSGADTRTTKIRNGTLSSGTGEAASELIITSNGVMDVAAVIADGSSDGVAAPLSLVKSGSAVLTLQAQNSFTGATFINQGMMRMAAGASLAQSSFIEVSYAATLDVSPQEAPFEVLPAQTLAGLGSVQGAVTVSGTLAPAPSADRSFRFNGDLVLGSGSALEVVFEPTGGAGRFGNIALSSGVLTIEDSARVVLAAPGVDFGTAYWRAPRRFRILSAPALGGDYAASRPLTLVAESAGGDAGGWALEYEDSGVSLRWTPGGSGATTPLQDWREAHFGTTGNEGSAADLADPDGDGLVNLIEYALGSDPLSAATGDGPDRAPALHQEGSGAGLRFLLPEEPPADLTYEVQVSADLVTWKTLASLASAGDWLWQGEGESRLSITTSAGWTEVVVGDELPAGSGAKRFLRLQVRY